MPTGFRLAEQCFTENTNMVGEPMSDPQTYNLNAGLLALVDELETRLQEIDRKLAVIANAAQRR